MPLSIVISYCSNEECFLEAILEQCSKASDDIVVSFGSHLFDGTPEDLSKIQIVAEKYPAVMFVQYPVTNNNYSGIGVKHRPQAYWHNMARWSGISSLTNYDWVLFLDADEIPEGDKLKQWWTMMETSSLLNHNTTYKMANYWYFKDPTNRAKVLEDSVLLIHAKYLSKYNIFGDMERDHLIQQSGTRLVRQTKGVKGEVLFHHYSWVRSRAGLTHKIKNWGHANEYSNPDAIIELIYSNDEVNDVIHKYSYDKVANHFNIVIE